MQRKGCRSMWRRDVNCLQVIERLSQENTQIASKHVTQIVELLRKEDKVMQERKERKLRQKLKEADLKIEAHTELLERQSQQLDATKTDKPQK